MTLETTMPDGSTVELEPDELRVQLEPGDVVTGAPHGAPDTVRAIVLDVDEDHVEAAYRHGTAETRLAWEHIDSARLRHEPDVPTWVQRDRFDLDISPQQASVWYLYGDGFVGGEDQSQRGVATTLGISRRAVRSQIDRVREAIGD